MSALHRLKAYFGMVPADEFDAAQFDDPAQFGDPGFDRHHYLSERPAHRRPSRVAVENAENYDDGFPLHAGHYAASRMHAPRFPSSSMDAPERSSRAAAPWAADASIRGSLAIDTAHTNLHTNPVHTNNRPPTRQPIAPPSFVHEPRADPLVDVDDQAHPLSRIVTLHPHSYNEARPIGERYREGNPVIMNLTAMEDRDAKRLVDFAAGLAFALRGSIDKVTNKVFLLSPPNVEVSAEDRRRIAEGQFFT